MMRAGIVVIALLFASQSLAATDSVHFMVTFKQYDTEPITFEQMLTDGNFCSLDVGNGFSIEMTAGNPGSVNGRSTIRLMESLNGVRKVLHTAYIGGPLVDIYYFVCKDKSVHFVSPSRGLIANCPY